MRGREPFAYALLRVVPNAERGESLNTGIVLFCRGRDFLRLRTAVPAGKLRALQADVDIEAIESHLRALELVASGDPEGGPMAAGSASARFHWLVAPTSTVVQPAEVHTGLCEDPEETLERLFRELVE
ncbi:MAG: hypothetical protein QOK05_3074 [Chloroflexota bacterium]|jgi:hypothetical protein|nr:hypothetical protein [Chloroflexota bacterium]